MSIERQKNKYNIIVIGCAMNKSDGERISGYMQALGFIETEVRSEADFVFILTCGVRQQSEDRIYGLVPEIKSQNPQAKVVISGCLSGEKNVIRRLKDVVDLWLPITDLSQLSNKLRDVIASSESDAAISKSAEIASLALAMTTQPYLSFVPGYKSKFSALVPIGNGCDNFCSYCFVPYARGRETYRPTEEILAEVESLVKKGYKEITLIAQNVNSYSSSVIARSGATRQSHDRSDKNGIASLSFAMTGSNNINFAQLLRLANSVDGKFWLRFTTSHPKDMSDELIRTIAECDKVCQLVHLPVQAGDNDILRAMNRKYTREHYLDLVARIRGILPDCSITTDVIVGFPGETREQFENTLDLFEKAGFDMVYPGKFSPRPGTAAAKMEDDVPKSEKLRREHEVVDVIRRTALANNRKLVGKTLDVLIEKRSKHNLIAKDRLGKTIKIMNSSDAGLIGNFAKARIVAAYDFGLDGELI